MGVEPKTVEMIARKNVVAVIIYYSTTISVFTMCGTVIQQKLDVPNIFPVFHEAWVLDILEIDLEAADAEVSPCNSYW